MPSKKKIKKISNPTDNTSIGQARAFLLQNMDGRRCPCCTQTVKLYRRYITASMAVSLGEIYRYFKEHPEVEWVHAQNYLASIKSHGSRGGDFAKLRFWGVVEQKHGDLRADGSVRVGLYKITDLGKEFVRGNTRLPKFKYIFNNVEYPPPPGDPSILFRDTIGDKFDYNRLLGFEPTKTPPPPTVAGEFRLTPPPVKPHRQIGMHAGRR